MIFFLLLAFLVFVIILIVRKKKDDTSTNVYHDISCASERNKNSSAITSDRALSISFDTETCEKSSKKKWSDITQEEIDSVKCCGDNMNQKNFKIRVKFMPTNRFRTFTVIAFNEDDALSKLSDDCDKSTASITTTEFPSPTERQIQYALYLEIEIPEKCCQYDLSTLLDNHETAPAPSSLFEFAQSRKLFFSYYADEPFLIRLIASSLSLQEWIAFAAICLRKELSHIWDFSVWEICMSYSEDIMNNSSFISSLKRSHLRDEFWGFEYSSYSRDSIFYKELHSFCVSLGGVSR